MTEELPPESCQLTLEMEWNSASGPWLVEVGSSWGSSCRTLEQGEQLVLGSSTRADVRLRDRAVSARHARLSATSEGVRVDDLGSKNGVLVDQARVGSALLPAAASCFVIGRTTVSIRPHFPEDETGQVCSLPGVIGSSSAMASVARQVRRHARHRASVLLRGESGTGKDLVARALHELSGRSGAFVPVNVGAISESLADAELFGHRRGAFTGAVTSRPGAFEQANRGTLFLDEIAELPHALQVKLLRVVEDGQVRPLGATETKHVDVRIVSASWAALDELVASGRFREDLYHRLAIVVIQLPPLRARKSDIAPLSTALLERMEPEVGKKRLTPNALARLVAHSWPGNVRELASVLYRAAANSDGVTIGPRQIDMSLPPGVRAGVPRTLRPEEARALLEEHDGNITAAAKAAGIPRSTFRSWLERSPPRR